MIKRMIKKKIKAALKELYNEYVKNGKITVTPDLKGKGVRITWSSK